MSLPEPPFDPPPPAKPQRLKRGDYLILAACAAFAGVLYYRLAYAIPYEWDWSAVPSFFLYYDEETGYRQNVLLVGLLNMLRIVVYATVLSLILGLGLALMRLSAQMERRASSPRAADPEKPN
ncbi:MAG: hypothetical protein AAGI34_14240 [Pseudomonadota bacterium]